jgi:hypothetical protein
MDGEKGDNDRIQGLSGGQFTAIVVPFTSSSFLLLVFSLYSTLVSFECEGREGLSTE